MFFVFFVYQIPSTGKITIGQKFDQLQSPRFKFIFRNSNSDCKHLLLLLIIETFVSCCISIFIQIGVCFFGTSSDWSTNFATMEEKVDEQLKSLEKTFLKDFGKEVSITVDWNTSKFSNKDNKYKLIEPTVKKGIFGDKASLLNWLKPSKRAMEFFLEKISNIQIVVTTDFTQQNKIGNQYYYVEFDGASNALKVTINDGYVNNCDGWGLKVDYLFGKFFFFFFFLTIHQI